MFGSSLLNSLSRYVITAVVAMAVGAGGALYVSGAHEAKLVAKEAKAVVAENAKATVEAAVENQQIVQSLDEKKAEAESVKEAVLDRIPEKESKVETTKVVYRDRQVPVPVPQECSPLGRDSVMPLDVGAVRLLNDLRAAKTVDLTGDASGESQASAGVTVAQFVSNDTDVVGMYNELAERHNRLVDKLMEFMARQAQDAQK